MFGLVEFIYYRIYPVPSLYSFELLIVFLTAQKFDFIADTGTICKVTG